MLYQRTLMPEIKKWIEEKETIILNGPRQVGKTSILELVKDELMRHKPAQTIFYLNLEEVNVMEPLNENPENLLTYIVNGKKRNYFLLDEIQYLDNPSNFLKHLYDKYKDKIKIICTGSSSLELKAKLQDSLVGRKISFNVPPLSFAEFLIFKESELTAYSGKEKIPRVIQDKMNILLDEYLLYGGMPAVVLKKDKALKKQLLSEYVNTYINKDIRAIGKIENILKFNQLIKLLAVQIGNLLNINELSNTLQMPRRELLGYINLLENTFVLKKLLPYFKNIRSQISKMPKYYWFDLGVRNQLAGNFENLDNRTDAGNLFENFIFNHLIASENKIFYYRTTNKSEIDFVAEKAGKIYPIEVKYKKLSRPLKANVIIDFSKKLKTERGQVVNVDYNYQDKMIDFVDYRRFINKIFKP